LLSRKGTCVLESFPKALMQLPSVDRVRVRVRVRQGADAVA